MGLFTSQFVDVIEWVDNTNDTIIWKFPRYENEIKMNAKLTVRESQQAVFMNEGTIADVFQPGLYSLQTKNLPILTTLRSWPYAFNSPFKADVFFVSTKQFIGQKWGTKNAITLNDDRFGMVELRAYGTFAYQVTDAGKFIKQVAGTEGRYSTDEVNDQLRSLMITRFTDYLGKGNYTIDKLAANLEDLSAHCATDLNADFDSYGLKVTKFLIENVSMPDDLKKEIFEYSRLNKIDMQKLAQFKTAESIEVAAANPGGTAASVMGAGMGLSMGMGMGGIITNTFANQGAGNAPPPVPAAEQFFIVVNGQQAGPYSEEQIGQMMQTGSVKHETLMWKAGMASWAAANSISELQSLFNNVPPPPPPVS